MSANYTKFNEFTQGLVPKKRIDPETLRQAKEWYDQFAGRHAVSMEDIELIEIYTELH